MKLVTEVEQEEEFLTNTLTRKLDALSREKDEALKAKSEAETQREALARSKADLENTLEAEQEMVVSSRSRGLRLPSWRSARWRSRCANSRRSASASCSKRWP